MSTQTYAIYAYSPSLNQEVRRFDLAKAQEDADWFCLLQNTNRYLTASDWQARISLETQGVDTLPGYIDPLHVLFAR
jgi:hypothetical protein